MEVETHPVQVNQRRGQATAPKSVTMAAYEVYCELHGEQKAMVTGGCRGGFSSGELIAYLYARSFPKHEWQYRTNEAIKGMNNL